MNAIYDIINKTEFVSILLLLFNIKSKKYVPLLRYIVEKICSFFFHFYGWKKCAYEGFFVQICESIAIILSPIISNVISDINLLIVIL